MKIFVVAQILIAFLFFPNRSMASTAGYQSGIIYNMQGPKASAWSMDGNKEKWLHENELEKDLINTTKKTDKLPFFRRELKTQNGGSFVKLKNVKADKLTYDFVKTYHKKNKSTKVIKNLVAGEWFILKLKNTNDYAILKITSIKDDGTSLLYEGDNMDYIAFEYTLLKEAPVEATVFKDDSFEEEEQPAWDTEAEMIIYPNPVVDKLTIKFHKATDNIGWTVLLENMDGKKVYQSETIYETHWSNDFSALPGGRYLLSVSKNNEVMLQKVIDKNDPNALLGSK